MAMKALYEETLGRVFAVNRGPEKTPQDLYSAKMAADYAGFSFTDGEPGYAFRRYFGENVRAVMGERDNQWITDQVMDIEVPEAMKPLRKAVNDLFPEVA